MNRNRFLPLSACCILLTACPNQDDGKTSLSVADDTDGSSSSSGDTTGDSPAPTTTQPTTGDNTTTGPSTSGDSTGMPEDSPTCGDGQIDADLGETCDAGDANKDNAACTSQCQIATCGDGLVHAGVEDCDDGNLVTGDSCSKDCRRENRIFASSETYAGDLNPYGGQNPKDLKGTPLADYHCQALAAAAGLSGEFLAWISDDSSSPSTKFKKGSGTYILTDAGNSIVAYGFDGLGDELHHGINFDENGVEIEDGAAWTNTNTDGTALVFDYHCKGWTVRDTSLMGYYGLLDATNDGKWTNYFLEPCNAELRLICVQQ